MVSLKAFDPDVSGKDADAVKANTLLVRERNIIYEQNQSRRKKRIFLRANCVEVDRRQPPHLQESHLLLMIKKAQVSRAVIT